MILLSTPDLLELCLSFRDTSLVKAVSCQLQDTYISEQAVQQQSRGYSK